MSSILQLDATAQAAAIKKGEISPAELVQLAIDAVERLNPKLNAVITPMYEQALELAKGALPDGPFKGVPMLMKDGIAAYKGIRQTSGSKLYEHFVSKEDSELVRRFKKAGFIIIGKTNMPEFGLLPGTEPRFFGPTRNPWDENCTPGGSSGGSAAAVAARIVSVAHSNDGGGSIRIPASCCGLFGLKPSRGRNPLGPQFGELVSGLAAEHVVSRSVRDTAAILDITGQPEYGAFYHAPAFDGSYLESLSSKKKLRIGFTIKSLGGSDLHPDCVAAVEKTVAFCKELGHEVLPMEIEIPFSGKQLAKVFSTIWAVCTTTPLASVERMTGKAIATDAIEPLTRALYEQGKKISAIDYEMTRFMMHRVARSVNKVFEPIDIWISATLASPPVPVGTFAQSEEDPMLPMRKGAEFAPMTALFNISGQPAASVPVHWNAANLPIGVQLVSKFGDEASIFQLAAQLEELVRWEQKRPAICAV